MVLSMLCGIYRIGGTIKFRLNKYVQIYFKHKPFHPLEFEPRNGTKDSSISVVKVSNMQLKRCISYQDQHIVLWVLPPLGGQNAHDGM